MEQRFRQPAAAAFVLMASFASAAHAGVVVYDKDGKTLEIGGRIQVQYTRAELDGEETTDRVFFRRLRPYIAGTVTENWYGKIQADFGATLDGDEVQVKDAYIQYRGFKHLKLTIGNAKTPFSREFLASSKRQQLVERSFGGDHNFGSPDRQLGFKLEGNTKSEKLTYALALGAEHHDPDVRRMDFDSPANNQSDWNEGVVIGGRVDFHPRGLVKYAQGDFKSDELRYSVSLAAFSWSNDGDNNTFTVDGVATSSSKADLDSASGIELSAGLRGHGVSIDVEYQMLSSDTVDGSFTGGLYLDGSSDLDKLAVEAGYMIGRFELVAGWDSLDASNYEEAWERTSVGVNYFWNKHKVKVQFTQRFGENFLGQRDIDTETTFLRFQFVF